MPEEMQQVDVQEQAPAAPEQQAAPQAEPQAAVPPSWEEYQRQYYQQLYQQYSSPQPVQEAAREQQPPPPAFYQQLIQAANTPFRSRALEAGEEEEKEESLEELLLQLKQQLSQPAEEEEEEEEYRPAQRKLRQPGIAKVVERLAHEWQHNKRMMQAYNTMVSGLWAAGLYPGRWPMPPIDEKQFRKNPELYAAEYLAYANNIILPQIRQFLASLNSNQQAASTRAEARPAHRFEPAPGGQAPRPSIMDRIWQLSPEEFQRLDEEMKRRAQRGESPRLEQFLS